MSEQIPEQIDTSLYGEDFYKNRPRKTTFAAERVVPLVLDILPETRTAADFGCGVGVWLDMLRRNGVGDIQGIDGPWVNRDMLLIPKECFTYAELNQPYTLDRRVDLVISLETAEHLFPENAATFVKTLCAASDYVLFSAAVPGQEGQNHFNEQWPEYWQALFEQEGYRVVDCIRGQIWHEEKIPYWYRQNILLYVKDDKLDTLDEKAFKVTPPLSIVHPLIFEERWRKSQTVKDSWKLFKRAVKRRIKRAFASNGNTHR